jgi:hypothetical protein
MNPVQTIKKNRPNPSSPATSAKELEPSLADGRQMSCLRRKAGPCVFPMSAASLHPAGAAWQSRRGKPKIIVWPHAALC